MNAPVVRLRFVALPTEQVRAYQRGAADANGQAPERHVSDGDGVACRHCLSNVAAGAPYLILAHRPFPRPQPYAEVGPIFLHADECDRHPDVAGLPAIFCGWPRMLMRGYGGDDRIIYGTGQMVGTAEIESTAAALLARADLAYLHLRSAANNCFHCRIERAA